jgi:exosortase/archaeosortase family protein
MTIELRRILIRIGLLLIGTAVVFIVAEQPMRQFETTTTLDLLRGLGLRQVSRASPFDIAIDSRGGVAFAAELTPACSSLASLLALIGLTVLRPPGPRWRLFGAVIVAMFTVFVGNIVRVAASIAVGVVAGPSSLVLFHDWVGSLFGFAYTLGGFLVMLYLLLPRDGMALTEICAARPTVKGPVPDVG